MNKNKGYLTQAEYIEPIMYYNLAKGENTTGKILNFYKVVEYFCDINRDQVLVNFIRNYERHVSAKELKSRLQKLLDAKELGKLVLLFEIMENELTHVINKACENKLVNSNNIEHFAKCFYKKRNQLVHSRDKTNILRMLSSNDLITWAEIFEQLAEICIDYFCFGIESVETEKV